MKSLIIMFLASLLAFNTGVFACSGTNKKPNCHCPCNKHTIKNKANDKN